MANGVLVVTEIISGLFTLLKAGISLQNLVREIRAQEEAGATPEQISAYIKDVRDKALAALRDPEPS